MKGQPALTEPFRIADVELRNRVLLAPLAGIGNWFVRLQAHRYGAGLAVSEMVSSFAIAHRNRRTLEEMLRIHPDEGPVSIQLFGGDPDVMREAAAVAAERRAAADRPQLRLPGEEGAEDRRRCRAARRARSRGRGRAGGRRGFRTAGHRQAPLGASVRRALWSRSRQAPCRRGRVSPRSHCIRARPRSITRAVPTTRWSASSSTRSTTRFPVIVSGGLRTAERARRPTSSPGPTR